MVYAQETKMQVGDIIVVLCLFFSAFASMLPVEVNKIALYGALPVAFVISYIKCQTFKINIYTNLLFTLFIWIVISSLWASYANYAVIELHRILGAFITCYVMAVNSKDLKMIPWLYMTYLVLYISAWYYMSNHIVMNIEAMSSDFDRMNDEKLNANTMAYYTFFVTFVLFILSEMCRSNGLKRILNIAFIAMIPLSFYVSLATASRQVLIIQIPLIALLLHNRYIKNHSVSRKLFFALCIIGVSALILPKVVSIYENSYLSVRASVDIKDDPRHKLLLDAYKVGIEHFPFGVGAGNYIAYSYSGHFSHISYLELFANQGVVGLFIYVYLLMSFFKRIYSEYKKTNDSFLLLFLIFGFIYIVDNFFYVFYIDIWLISFFVLVASHSETYLKYHNNHVENIQLIDNSESAVGSKIESENELIV